MEPIILVHGGAGDIHVSRVAGKIEGVKKAALIGFQVLKNTSSILDAVEAAVRYMEDDEYFNAGRGSVLNLNGEVEMDASIMLGADLRAGAVTVVREIAHPISLARLVMEKTDHVLLAGEGANKFADEQGVEPVSPGSLITDVANITLANYKQFMEEACTELESEDKGDVGTVGAVAIDAQGRLAAATSTGGLIGKKVGRSSDTSVIGSGTYADDFVGAVSTTGHGETIMKFCLAHAIINEMKNGLTASAATNKALQEMTARLNNTAGAITIGKNGDIGIGFTSKHMAWAYIKYNELHFGINQKEDVKEILDN